ncbi:MAG: hypothetical protein K0S20_516 [Patescibacteria group bacterium]|nr:hypothetical protein [Patescibacteria group bacterium]
MSFRHRHHTQVACQKDYFLSRSHSHGTILLCNRVCSLGTDTPIKDWLVISSLAAPSSRGLGRRVFIPEITGSNPVGATKAKMITLAVVVFVLFGRGVRAPCASLPVCLNGKLITNPVGVGAILSIKKSAAHKHSGLLMIFPIVEIQPKAKISFKLWDLEIRNAPISLDRSSSVGSLWPISASRARMLGNGSPVITDISSAGCEAASGS